MFVIRSKDSVGSNTAPVVELEVSTVPPLEVPVADAPLDVKGAVEVSDPPPDSEDTDPVDAPTLELDVDAVSPVLDASAVASSPNGSAAQPSSTKAPRPNPKLRTRREYRGSQPDVDDDAPPPVLEPAASVVEPVVESIVGSAVGSVSGAASVSVSVSVSVS